MSEAQMRREHMRQPEDDRSTSIDQLQDYQQPPPQQQQNKNNMVENIMDKYQDMELNEDDSVNNEDIYNRQMMDNVNEPPHNNSHIQENMEPSTQAEPQNSNNSNSSSNNKSLISSAVDALKGPLVVMVLFFVLNRGFVVNMIESIFKNQLGEESSYSMFGLVFRSFVASIIFFVINYFS